MQCCKLNNTRKERMTMKNSQNDKATLRWGWTNYNLPSRVEDLSYSKVNNDPIFKLRGLRAPSVEIPFPV